MGLGSLIDMLLVPVGATILFSMIALFVAFFNRTNARWCAGLAFATFIFFYSTCMSLHKWDLESLPFVLLARSPVTAVMCGCMFFALIASFAPLRRQDKSLPNEVPGREKPIHSLLPKKRFDNTKRDRTLRGLKILG